MARTNKKSNADKSVPQASHVAAEASDPAEPVSLDDPSLYLNRELSLLAFQERVLEEAEDPTNPLLERVKFLAIMSSNLAEFFMVRIGGLKQQVAAGVSEVSPDGMTPAEQLEAARDGAISLMRRGRELYRVLCEELEREGIHLLGYSELDSCQRAAADSFFSTTVYPVLTPLAHDPGRPFPHISNLSLNLAVLVRDRDGEERFARVKIPKALPRLVEVPRPGTGKGSRSRGAWFVWIDQLVTANLDTLFPGLEVVSSHAFRVTRDAEFAIQELEADDLLGSIEEGLRRRRFGSVVRVTVDGDMPKRVRRILTDNMRLSAGDMIVLDPPLGFSDLMALYKLDRPDLKDRPFTPVVPAGLEDPAERDMFAAIREHDVLLHRPFESFAPVVDLLRQAARDPDVLAIKMTLYRVGRDSPVVEALLEAAEAGKEVAALVELKARFDEESNIGWARRLEAAGVHVVYGLLGLKTHSKIGLIVRREGKRIRRYLHVGTGNYNVVTATQYTDFDLLTTDDRMCEDATRLFNALTGYADEREYRDFLVAPVTMRDGFAALLRREIKHAKAGRDAHVILKMNALVDPAMTRLLYEASQAGVRVDLLVRGVCSLRPSVAGISDTITVRSFVGRFLEHTRVYWFANAGAPEVLIGSADLMPRNLDRRVEVLAPVKSPLLVVRLREEVLDAYLKDDARTRVLGADGVYRQTRPDRGERTFDAQEWLLERAAADKGMPRAHG